MRFHKTDDKGSIADIRSYFDYLQANETQLPPGVRAFALSDWFHDRKDSRCPHDCWLEQLSIREIASAGNKDIRSTMISASFLGAYHDGIIEFVYKDVTSYSITGLISKSDGSSGGHGDWLMDEIALDAGGIAHEIVFSGSAHWIIRCADMTYQWVPLPSPQPSG